MDEEKQASHQENDNNFTNFSWTIAWEIMAILPKNDGLKSREVNGRFTMEC